MLHAYIDSVRGLAEGSLAFLARAHSGYEKATMELKEPVYSYQVLVPIGEEGDGDVF